jgi:hypothetical protein
VRTRLQTDEEQLMRRAVQTLVGSWKRTRISSTAAAPPSSCIAMKAGAEAGAIPANESENIRPTVIAGLAKLVELVNQQAAAERGVDQ